MTVKIPSPGNLRGPSTKAPHIWALPLHLPGHCGWESAHHLGHPLILPPPHAHALLPLQPVLSGQLHLHHCPQMLVNIQTQSKAISYAGCITQMSYVLLFVELDSLLLAVMAYDRLVAICHPLHYTVIMNPWLCMQLVLVCWVISVLHALLQSLMMLWLSFCTYLEFPHFFCELNQVAQLACCGIFLNDIVIYIAIILLALGPLAGILYSYSNIVSSICAIP